MVVSVTFWSYVFEFIGDGGIDLDTDTFSVALMTTDHTHTATHTAWSDVSANELASGNGYSSATGATPKNLGSVTWTTTDGMQIFDAADVQWTAAGGSIGPAGYAVVFDTSASTPTNDLLLLEVNFGQAETAGDGTTFNINWSSTGIFHVS